MLITNAKCIKYVYVVVGLYAVRNAEKNKFIGGFIWNFCFTSPTKVSRKERNLENLSAFAAVDIFLHCAEKLEEMRDLERKEDMFTPVPSPYYMELTKLLLNQ